MAKWLSLISNFNELLSYFYNPVLSFAFFITLIGA